MSRDSIDVHAAILSEVFWTQALVMVLGSFVASTNGMSEVAVACGVLALFKAYKSLRVFVEEE